MSDGINVVRNEFRRNCTILNFRFEQDVLNRKSRSNWVTLNEKFVEFFFNDIYDDLKEIKHSSRNLSE